MNTWTTIRIVYTYHFRLEVETPQPLKNNNKKQNEDAQRIIRPERILPCLGQQTKRTHTHTHNYTPWGSLSSGWCFLFCFWRRFLISFWNLLEHVMSLSPSLPSHCHPTKFVKGYFLVDAAGILVGWDRSSENCFSHLTGLQVAQNVLFCFGGRGSEISIAQYIWEGLPRRQKIHSFLPLTSFFVQRFDSPYIEYL